MALSESRQYKRKGTFHIFFFFFFQMYTIALKLQVVKVGLSTWSQREKKEVYTSSPEGGGISSIVVLFMHVG